MTIGRDTRLTIAIMALPPKRRVALEAVLRLRRRVNLKAVCESLSVNWSSRSRVHDDLIALWSCGLLERIGQLPAISYRPAADVSRLLAAHRSYGFERSRLHAGDGEKVLETARRLAADRMWPSGNLIAEGAGVGRSVAFHWMGILKCAGMFPDLDGLNRNQRANLTRAIRRANPRIHRRPDEVMPPREKTVYRLRIGAA
jgi:hypothetical protein